MYPQQGPPLHRLVTKCLCMWPVGIQQKKYIMYIVEKEFKEAKDDEEYDYLAEKQSYILSVCDKLLHDSFTALMKCSKEEMPDMHHNLSCRH